MMSLENWLLDKACDKVLVRMELTDLTDVPGFEDVCSSFVTARYVDTRWILVHAQYDRSAASSEQLTIKVVQQRIAGSEVVNDILSLWESIEGWDVWNEKVVTLRTRAWTRKLNPSNVLVTQHLARIQGAIGQAQMDFDPEVQLAIKHLSWRLGSLISQSNREMRRLVAFS